MTLSEVSEGLVFGVVPKAVAPVRAQFVSPGVRSATITPAQNVGGMHVVTELLGTGAPSGSKHAKGLAKDPAAVAAFLDTSTVVTGHGQRWVALAGSDVNYQGVPPCGSCQRSIAAPTMFQHDAFGAFGPISASRYGCHRCRKAPSTSFEADLLGAAGKLKQAAKFIEAHVEGAGWDKVQKLLGDKTVVETFGEKYGDLLADADATRSDVARAKEHRLESLQPRVDSAPEEDQRELEE